MTLEIIDNATEVKAVLTGRLDTAASSQFAKDMQPLMALTHKRIILDCEKLEFISSSGLRLFLTLRKESIAHGGEVCISGMCPEVKQVFALTGFMTLFEFL